MVHRTEVEKVLLLLYFGLIKSVPCSMATASVLKELSFSPFQSFLQDFKNFVSSFLGVVIGKILFFTKVQSFYQKSIFSKMYFNFFKFQLMFIIYLEGIKKQKE